MICGDPRNLPIYPLARGKSRRNSNTMAVLSPGPLAVNQHRNFSKRIYLFVGGRFLFSFPNVYLIQGER